ncbi:MAG: PorT family protein [Marinifilaceae bacterium]|jgi:hypothetical protein|nr:PorT family protein [Marinifilaceae bacterium]
MIKRLFLVITITTCVLSSIFAQDGKKTKFGIKGGLNLSNIYGKNVENNDLRASFHLGGFIEYALNNNWYIQPEIIYSQQGTTDTSNTFELNYIAVPLMFKYYFNNKFNIEFGPQFNYSVNAKIKNDKVSLDISDEINQKDFTAGINFGCGVHFSSHLAIYARYNLGLTNIIKENEHLLDENIKNIVFQLSLAFKF